MLTESICASILVESERQIASTLPIVKDASIFTLDLRTPFRPTTIYKKSSTRPGSLAVSKSHVFAAQADKAVIHVYNRTKGNQEATIPFGEKVTVVATAGRHGEYLVMGTENGNVSIWETFSGRLIKAEQSHIQAVTALAVDQSSQYFLTGSADSTVLVWSLVSLLSFTRNSPDALDGKVDRSPIHTLSDHTASITAIALGHSSSSSNYAVTTAEDKSALIWHYMDGILLRTYLLGDVPRTIAMDSADRAIYFGFDDGGVQMIDLYQQSISSNSTIQQPKSRWLPPTSETLDAMMCLCVSFDSTKLISGHRSGKVSRWDVGRRQYLDELCILPGLVTNILSLPIHGLVNHNSPSVQLGSVTKPKAELETLENMTIMAEFGELSLPYHDPGSVGLESILLDPCFSADIAHSAIDALHQSRRGNSNKALVDEPDFMSLEDDQSQQLGKDEQLQAQQQQLDSLKRLLQEKSKIISELKRERASFIPK